MGRSKSSKKTRAPEKAAPRPRTRREKTAPMITVDGSGSPAASAAATAACVEASARAASVNGRAASVTRADFVRCWTLAAQAKWTARQLAAALNLASQAVVSHRGAKLRAEGVKLAALAQARGKVDAAALNSIIDALPAPPAA